MNLEEEDKKRKILFVCQSAIDRSKTFFEVYAEKNPHFDIDYKGTEAYYEKDQLKLSDIESSFCVYCMTYDEYFWIVDNIGKTYNVNVIGIDSFRQYKDNNLIRQAEFHWEHYGKTLQRLILQEKECELKCQER